MHPLRVVAGMTAALQIFRPSFCLPLPVWFLVRLSYVQQAPGTGYFSEDLQASQCQSFHCLLCFAESRDVLMLIEDLGTGSVRAFYF